MRTTFNPAASKDLKALYRLFCTSLSPFFVDIAGPERHLNYADFADYCLDDDAILCVLKEMEEIVAFFLLRDVQPGLELSNIDLWYLNGFPIPGSKAAADLDRSIRGVCAKANLTRIQLLAAAFETDKIELVLSLGFKQEGRLISHFFHAGARHDLVMLGRLDSGRQNA